MNGPDFDYLCSTVKERSGIVLTPEKAYLVDNRLAPIARRTEHEDVPALLATLRAKKEEALLREVTDALTTNESFFFRDQKPFDAFRDIMLPHILEENASKRSVRIWCAACSSGQEPYSLAMILKDHAAKMPGWKIDIIGTDISHTILERAEEGSYTQFEVQRGLPAKYLVQHFQKDNDLWTVSDELKQMVSYRFFNLLDDPTSLGTFDIIFCRNVLIYFDPDTKTKVLDGIAKSITPNGFLTLGAAETIFGLSEAFVTEPGRNGVYRKTSSDPASGPVNTTAAAASPALAAQA
ncbi:MAG: chemotaxis protein CheR [Alphaproteobacteria bacterium]|nr:chemotaxis protein CheR [Alphaproteobacteria bacterium]